MFNNELWQKPAGGGADFYDYQIANSARFDGSSTYLTRTASGASTNSDKKAISFWFKKSGEDGLTGNQYMASCAQSKLAALFVNEDSDNVGYYTDNGGQNGKSKFKKRDFSAWYHLVFLYDATLATGVDRVKYYLNGVHYTTGDTTFWNLDNNGYPSLNAQIGFGMQSNENNIGRYQYNGTGYFNGYIADFIMIDGGTVPSISDFGETKNGVWVPKDPSGLTFGSNGCWLKFTNSSDFGEDFSGNNNDWTANNLAASDQMLDSPTFNSDSNGGNFCTLNPVYRGEVTTDAKYGTISEGNLKLSYTSNNDAALPGTIKTPASGKWYFEYLINAGGGTGSYSPGAGIIDVNEYTFNTPGYNAVGAVQYANSLNKVYKGSSVSGTYGGSRGSNGDVMGIAVDLDNGAFYVSKNGTFQGISGGSTGDPTSGASKTGAGATWTPASEFTSGMVPLAAPNGGSVPIITMNFGQDGTFAGEKTAGGYSDTNGYGNFFSSVPSGYSAICSGALTIADAINPAQTDNNFPQKLFNPLIWTGDGTTSRAITGLGFQPDWLWFKSRSSAFSHRLYDTSRGISGTGGKRLSTNSSNAENDQTSGQDISAVGTDGFTLGASSNLYTNDTNSGGLQVGWFWRANGGTTAANGNGGTSSVTQVDPSGALSIVTYTGFAGASGTSTVGHGLSTAPTMIIHKSRTRGSGWWTQVPGLLTDAGYFLNMESDGSQTDLNSYGTMNAPSTSVFTINGVDGVGGESANYVAYCFANIEGYCKVGSYVGNADDDGTFLYTGFRPAFFMCKPLVTGNWRIQDNKRTPFNVADKTLFPNSSNAELSNDSNDIDLLSNGVKMRASDSDYNQATTFIYLAMAENPFKYATAR